MQINRYIDHTLLKPQAGRNDIVRLCSEAKTYDFHSVCVNGSFVALAKTCLKRTDVKVCAVVGFPLGAMSTEAKAFEAKDAISEGADEIDMVIHIGHLKNGKHDLVEKDIRAVKEAIGDKILKVILETTFLSEGQIERGCLLSIKAGADFVKTSTGFGGGGATMEAVEIMKRVVGEKAKIKASGGIRDFETAQQFINAGVHRLGVSAGVAIMEGLSSNEDY